MLASKPFTASTVEQGLSDPAGANIQTDCMDVLFMFPLMQIAQRGKKSTLKLSIECCVDMIILCHEKGF